MRKFFTVLCLALSAMTLVAVVALVFPSFKRYQAMKARYYDVAEESAKAKSELTRLHQELRALEYDPKAVEKIAREKFNYCEENEIVYKFGD